MAIEAVRRFGEVIRENPELKSAPGLGPLRRQLLEEPINFFRDLNDRLRRDQDATPESLARLASASSMLGLLLEQVGNKEEALRSYRQAESVWGRLHAADAGNLRYRVELARQRYFIGFLLAGAWRSEEALRMLDQARRMQEGLVAEKSGGQEYLAALGTTCHAIGNLQMDMGRRDQARAAFEQALPLWERLDRADPSKILYSGDILWAKSRIAESTNDLRGTAAVLAAYEKARLHRERLYDEHRSQAWYQLDLAANHLYMAKLFQVVPGRLRDAEATYKQIIPVWEELIRGDPLHPRFREDLALTYHELGSTELALDEPAAAEAAFGQALRYWEALIEEDPNSARTAVGLAATLRRQAQIARERHNRDGAMAMLRRGNNVLSKALATFPECPLIKREQDEYQQSLLQTIKPATTGDGSVPASTLGMVPNLRVDPSR